MGQRLDLQALLKTITPVVYFQPPSNVQMQYPCIVYELDDADTKFADNLPYSYAKRYMVTIIDADPDSVIPDKVALLPMSSFSRRFSAENLYHTVFNVYF